MIRDSYLTSRAQQSTGSYVKVIIKSRDESHVVRAIILCAEYFIASSFDHDFVLMQFCLSYKDCNFPSLIVSCFQ